LGILNIDDNNYLKMRLFLYIYCIIIIILIKYILATKRLIYKFLKLILLFCVLLNNINHFNFLIIIYYLQKLFLIN